MSLKVYFELNATGKDDEVDMIQETVSCQDENEKI